MKRWPSTPKDPKSPIRVLEFVSRNQLANNNFDRHHPSTRQNLSTASVTLNEILSEDIALDLTDSLILNTPSLLRQLYQ